MSELFNLTPANTQNIRNIENATATNCLAGFIADKAAAAKVEAAALASGTIEALGLTFDVYTETLTTAKGYTVNVPNTPDKSGRDRCKVYIPTLAKSRSVAQALVMMVLDAAGIGYPMGYQIHHIDGDHTNNSLNNLVVVTPAMHKRLHYLMDEVARGWKTEREYMDIVEEVRVRF